MRHNISDPMVRYWSHHFLSVLPQYSTIGSDATGSDVAPCLRLGWHKASHRLQYSPELPLQAGVCCFELYSWLLITHLWLSALNSDSCQLEVWSVDQEFKSCGSMFVAGGLLANFEVTAIFSANSSLIALCTINEPGTMARLAVIRIGAEGYLPVLTSHTVSLRHRIVLAFDRSDSGPENFYLALKKSNSATGVYNLVVQVPH